MNDTVNIPEIKLCASPVSGCELRTVGFLRGLYTQREIEAAGAQLNSAQNEEFSCIKQHAGLE